MSGEEMAELSALADGTLPVGRRAEIEARVAASPELQVLVERQRLTALAVRLLADEQVPPSLKAAVEECAHRRRSSLRRGGRLPRLLVAGAAVVTVVVVAAVGLSGSPGATVAAMARLGTMTPTSPAPVRSREPMTKLAIAVDGVTFPNFRQFAGWRALGVRFGRIAGREATAVIYGKGARRIGYVIVAGTALARPSGAEATLIRRVEYQTFRSNGKAAVTWRREGHTCVLVGEAMRPELLRLASWSLTKLPR